MNWDTGYGLASLAPDPQVGARATGADRHRRPPAARARPGWRRWARWILTAASTSTSARPTAAAAASPPARSSGCPRASPARASGSSAPRASPATRPARSTRRHPARAPRPPALYAFDPDTGRLAVTTPAYSTAIMPVTQGAFRYGGIELARFHDAGNEPAATIGGRPPAAFGLRVRDARHRRVLVTQEPRRHLGGRPLWLTRAPHGVGVPPTTHARTAYAGPFTDLRAAGVVRARSVKATVRHRFTRSFVQTTLDRAAPRRPLPALRRRPLPEPRRPRGAGRRAPRQPAPRRGTASGRGSARRPSS